MTRLPTRAHPTTESVEERAGDEGSRVPAAARRSWWAVLVAALLVVVVVPSCAPDAPSSSTSATTRPTTAAKLAIVSPEPGATTGSTIVLHLRLSGATVVRPSQVTGIEPTEGHIHVSVDGKLVSMAYGLTQTVRNLTPGEHTVLASFVASDHRPFANQVVATVVFQVR